MQNNAENNRHPRLYDIDKFSAAFDAALASRQRPRDATIRSLADKISRYLAEGYSIADVVALLQTAGMDGTDRQIRYALSQAGIDGAAGKATRAARRRAGAGRSHVKKAAGKSTPAEQPATSAQEAEAVNTAQTKPKTVEPESAPKKVPPSQEGQTAAKEKETASHTQGQTRQKETAATSQTSSGMLAFGQSDANDGADLDSLL